MMSWLWIALGVLALLAGFRARWRVRSARSRGAGPTVDDAALRQILDRGTFVGDEDDDAPLDLDAAAEAEEQFWSESWDEPDEM